jgi:hypothetical protein
MLKNADAKTFMTVVIAFRDEILDNETELPIMEHTTDTAGYTELVSLLINCNSRISLTGTATLENYLRQKIR